jgi:membrane associated rhomboid family serine protease
MGATLTTRPSASGPSAADPSVVNPLQPSGPYKQRRTSLTGPMIVWGLLLLLVLALMLMPVVGWFLAAGEWVCLDRNPIWGPPENPDVYTSCSGHIDELLRKWGWVT